MRKFNYYKDQLDRLKPDNKQHQSIKLFDGQGNSTNQMDLNLESIDVLLKYLQKEKQRIKDSNNE